jgi:hypothetical protein
VPVDSVQDLIDPAQAVEFGRAEPVPVASGLVFLADSVAPVVLAALIARSKSVQVAPKSIDSENDA